MDVIKIIEPTIRTKPIEFSPQYEDGHKLDIAGEKLGASSPYITINHMAFWDNTILEFILDTSGFLPKVSMILVDTNQLLVNEFMPINDIACVYLRSDNVDFDSIRQDFRITSFYKVREDVYSVEGLLHIPLFFNTVIQSFKGTSLECIKEIAKEHGLGFATNVSDTNDSMYHLCTNQSHRDFIELEVMKYIYSNDESFFICYIDQFYYINLVEINSLLKVDAEVEMTSVVGAGGELHDEKDRMEDVLLLGNLPINDGKPNFINSYKPINVSGIRGIRDGYRQNILYYDKNDKSHVQFFIESLTTKGIDSDDRVIKGEVDEDYTKNIRNNVFDSLFKDNAHENYFYATVSNRLNVNEINKIMVEFNMNGVNFGLANYMTVPIAISNNSQMYKDLNENNDEMNISLTGNYIITGMRYIYRIDNPFTRLSFVGKRREIRKRFIDETI